jgi:hypothetical protein
MKARYRVRLLGYGAPGVGPLYRFNVIPKRFTVIIHDALKMQVMALGLANHSNRGDGLALQYILTALDQIASIVGIQGLNAIGV